MSTTRSICLLLLSLFAFTALGSAASLQVSVSGVFDSSIVAGPLAAPNETFSVSFIINSTPAASSVTTAGFDVPFSNFTYTLNGTVVNVPAQEIEFFNTANNGLFTLFFGPQSGYTSTGAVVPEFEFDGPQAFTGSTSSPSFAAGTFNTTDWIYSDANNYDVQTVTDVVRLAAVPEPSTMSLFALAGGLVIAARFGYKRFSNNAR